MATHEVVAQFPRYGQSNVGSNHSGYACRGGRHPFELTQPLRVWELRTGQIQ